MSQTRFIDANLGYPLHVVTGWLGNTPKIALKHYLQITDDDFERAIQGAAESDAKALQNTMQQSAAPESSDEQETIQAPDGSQGLVRILTTSC